MATYRPEIHGPKRNTSEYNALKNAIARCHNSKHQSYHNYGHRGIKVHPLWHGPEGFAHFIEHIGWKTDPSLTLERIDNSKGYIPGNVTWADRATQQRNRRKQACSTFSAMTLVTYNGKTQNWKTWAAEIGIQVSALRQRIARGLPLAEILAPRQRQLKNKVLPMMKGTTMTLVDWSSKNSIPYDEVRNAVRRGFDADEIIARKHMIRAPMGEKHYFRGEWLTLVQIAKVVGSRAPFLRDRLRRGYSLEEAVVSKPRPGLSRAKGRELDLADDPCRATVDQVIALLGKSVSGIESRKH